MASDKWEEYSVIGDKGEVGFIDFADDQSVSSYNPDEEGPVIISVPFPFVSGKPQSVLVGEMAADSITITNTTKEELELWGLSIYASNPEDSFLLSLMKPPSGNPDDVPQGDFVGSYSLEDRILRPLQTLTVWLSCQPKEIGVHTSIVNIDVGDDRVERIVFLLAEDGISKALASDKPYCRGRKKNVPFTMDSYVMGVRPANTMKRTFKNKLPLYPIPKEDRELIASNQIHESVMDGLSRRNYASYFKSLLIMEELRLEEDMKVYDMEFVSMKRRGHQFLALEVPGLAERRPSLVHGDAIFAKLATHDSENGSVYEGYIHRVAADEIYLQFAYKFHHLHSDDNLYNVHFAYNRVNFRRLYQAIEAAHASRANFLFPSDYAGMRRIKPSRILPISHVLNEEQRKAVDLILGCKGGAPYVIHGPPGTGKTKTLVELILQLYKNRLKSRLLVCASSNCAADHILEQIMSEESVKVREGEIFRLNAASRPYEDVSPDFLKFCFFDDLIFKCPPLEALLHYRIVVTTYMSASILNAEGVKQGHFSHIILDEAGQASEPETMIPIANLSHKNNVIILAGDPKQLGPVIHSRDAECYGLGKSYLERLFESVLYNKGDQNYVTMLVRNYRCHPEILSLPSKMFYNDMLIAAREVAGTLPWADLLNTNFPVLFYGIQGLDEREGSNPSWFNRIEVSKVVEIIKKLVARNVDEHNIGVITPYRQQVMKIKKALEGLDMPNIKIGSVEQFQGQEREVIIVSTVRSTIKHNEFDQTFCLGFLSNPKRFNVAMTRARSLLVIVGNPHIVSKDQYWEQLLWYCADNDSYQGCGLPEKMSCLSDMGPMTGDWDPDGDTASKMWDWSPDETVGAEIRDEGLDENVASTVGDWVSNEEKGDFKKSKEAAEPRREWFPIEYLPKPVKDEDEWSDGWK